MSSWTENEGRNKKQSLRGQKDLLPHPMHAAEMREPREQKWWCVVFDYVAVQSKAVMLLSHLDRISSGGKLLFVRLPRTVTAWQPRSHQRDGQREKREPNGCLWQVCGCVCGVLRLSPPCPCVCRCILVCVCSLLQYACESVNSKNVMRPTGSLWLQYIVFPSFRHHFGDDRSFISESVPKVQLHATKSIDLSARVRSELIIKELSELEAGKGI